MPAFVVVRVWVATFYIHAATAAIGYLVVDEEFGPIALVQVDEDVKVHKFNPFFLLQTHSQVGLGLIEMTSYALHHDPTLLMLHYQNIDAVLEIATLNIYDSVEKENGDRQQLQWI